LILICNKGKTFRFSTGFVPDKINIYNFSISAEKSTKKYKETEKNLTHKEQKLNKPDANNYRNIRRSMRGIQKLITLAYKHPSLRL